MQQIRELAAMSLSNGAQEPVAQWQYRFFDGVKWVDWANCTEFLVKHKDGRDDFQFRALFERAHPQPTPQTDAAREVLDHETALRGCRILSNIVSAYEEGNHSGIVIHLIGVATSWFAEIERLERAKGE